LTKTGFSTIFEGQKKGDFENFLYSERISTRELNT